MNEVFGSGGTGGQQERVDAFEPGVVDLGDIIDEVAPRDGELVIRKAAASGFLGTPLIGHLVDRGIDTIIVGGESTSGCVRASVVDGCGNRFKMIVVEECVFDRHEACHAINLFDMSQKYADVVPLDEALAYLDAVAEGSNGANTRTAV